MHYFTFTAPKFNHDVVQLPFWALSGYAYWAALRRGRTVHWLLLGFGIGMAFWAKYFVVVQVAPLALFALFDRDARKGSGPSDHAPLVQSSSSGAESRRACAPCGAIVSWRGRLACDGISPKFVASKGDFIDEDEGEVSAEIGCAPPISQPLRGSIRSLMNTVPHEFVTVDMRGLKAALVARAREQRVSVSVVVRDALTKALPLEAGSSNQATPLVAGAVKLSIRLTADEAERFAKGADAARLSRGAFLAGLVDGVRVLSSGGRNDYLSALIASNAELSTLSRNVRHLATLLARSDMRAAQQYRSMLDSLAGDVEKHLHLVGDALKQMRPQHGSLLRPRHVAEHKEEKN